MSFTGAIEVGQLWRSTSLTKHGNRNPRDEMLTVIATTETHQVFGDAAKMTGSRWGDRWWSQDALREKCLYEGFSAENVQAGLA